MEKLVEQFGEIYVLIFKYLSRLGICASVSYKFLNQTESDGFPTYGEYLSKFKKLCQSNKIMDMIEDLEKDIDPIKDLRFEDKHDITGELTCLEYRLNTVMLKTVIKLIREDVPLQVASKLTGIPETTIKHACQKERLMNVYKRGNSWVVNLNEIQEYWGCEIDPSKL